MSMKTILQAITAQNDNYASSRIDPSVFSAFTSELTAFIAELNKANGKNESEENIKNIINGFLKRAVYPSPEYTINTKNNIDSAISCDDKLLVMIEAKKPSNKSEMITTDDINKKAFHELILYYLVESRNVDGEKVKRNRNSEIKRLIVTSGYDWFIFDANDIERLCDNYLEKHYYKYKHNQLNYSNNNGKFYEDISSYLTEKKLSGIDYIYFNINTENKTVSGKRTLYKVLSAPFLLKETPKLQTREHSLNEKFYKELLYIMGLQEIKVKNKPQITINLDIENTFAAQLYKKFKIDKDIENEEVVKEKTFELIIIWLNRLLFIKLFEGQLISFNDNNDDYRILNTNKVKNFDDLMNLFFNVLGKKSRENNEFYDKFKNIPYLNSSLFERQEIERADVNINEIKNDYVIVKNNTIFGKRAPKKLPLLQYIIDFLNSYTFCSDSNCAESNNIIDAAVLGLIFEKINGYKDGAIYTPSIITEYICKESLTQVIINKVNTTLSWKCESFDDIVNMIRETDIKERLSYRKKINDIINHITICDPAVGSGHFLVSALNFLIASKQRLGVLFYYESDDLVEDYTVTVVNDVLTILDGQENYYIYNKNSAKSQKLQKTLFNEKRTIIEKCLFGVDINPKAVYICQLRLWIELLKNAYYEKGVMETLPNIDIKLKVGNSLVHKIKFEVGKSISRGNFEVNKSDWDKYKQYVKQYIETSDKATKSAIKQTIANIKFGLHNAYEQLNLFETSSKSYDYDEVFKEAFEWAIEFPEIINENGVFLGFDCVIGNPPYIDSETMKNSGLEKERKLLSEYYSYARGNWDIYIPFFELGFKLLSPHGIEMYISPDKWISKSFGDAFRINAINNIRSIFFAGRKVFSSALVDSIITCLSKDVTNEIEIFSKYNDIIRLERKVSKKQLSSPFALDILASPFIDLINKIKENTIKLSNIVVCENACATSDCYKLKGLLLDLDNDLYDPNHYMKVINTGTIGRFVGKWGHSKMTYLGDKYLFPVAKRQDFLSTFSNSYGSKAVSPKLIIKGLTLLDCCIDENGEIIPGKQTLVIRGEVDKLYCVMGIINSKLMSFFIKQVYSSSSYNGGITFTYEMINNLPFKNDSNDEYRKICNLSREITKKLKLDITSDVSDLLMDIDNTMFKIFGLSEDEIRIVNNN